MSSLHTARQVACPCPTTLQSSSRTRTQRTSHLWRGRGRGGLGSIRRRCSCSLPPAIIAPSWPPGSVKTEGGGGGGGRSSTTRRFIIIIINETFWTLLSKMRERFVGRLNFAITPTGLGPPRKGMHSCIRFRSGSSPRLSNLRTSTRSRSHFIHVEAIGKDHHQLDYKVCRLSHSSQAGG